MSSDPTGWHRADDVAYVDDGERVAVLALDALDPLGARLLTGPAAAIWQAIGHESEEKAIIAAVAHEFAADASTIEADVRGFLADLLAQGLLVSR